MFPGITHVIVSTCSEEDYKVSSVLAYVDLCFGPGNNDRIRAIPYKRIGPKSFAFQSPNTIICKGGKKVLTTTFSGVVDTEICTIALRAMEQVKKLGSFKFNKKYQVTDIGAEEEKEQVV